MSDQTDRQIDREREKERDAEDGNGEVGGGKQRVMKIAPYATAHSVHFHHRAMISPSNVEAQVKNSIIKSYYSNKNNRN